METDKTSRENLVARIKDAVLALEPEAEIILYGSRARGDADEESDWDLLIILEGRVDNARADRVRNALYEVEWDLGEVLCSIIYSRRDWETPLYRAMPFHESVDREGILL